MDFTCRNGEEANHYAILESLGGGVGLIDYDGDGLLDVFLSAGGTLVLRGRLAFGSIGARKSCLGGRSVLIDVDAVALERREKVVDFLRGMDLGRQNIVDLIVEQVTPFLAHGDELSYLIVFFLKSQTHTSSHRGVRQRRTSCVKRNMRPELDTPARLVK